MIKLYHCMSARSFRALWALEELGLDYELMMLPFPPRMFKKEYLGINPWVPSRPSLTVTPS